MPTAKFKSGDRVIYKGYIFSIEGSPYYKEQGNPPGWYYDLPLPDLKQIHELNLSPTGGPRQGF
jgi:hypothetical protein